MMRHEDYRHVAYVLERFDEVVEDFEGIRFTKNSKELLVAIFNEWAKHKSKVKKDKKFLYLLKGFSGYLNERVPVRPKRSKK